MLFCFLDYHLLSGLYNYLNIKPLQKYQKSIQEYLNSKELQRHQKPENALPSLIRLKNSVKFLVMNWKEKNVKPTTQRLSNNARLENK